MNDAVYRIVEHDGGWAYKLGDVFSETFPSRRLAELAANRVAEEQRSPGDDEAISWEDERGVWHDEDARGGDRPNAYVAAAEALQRSARNKQPHSGHRSGASSRTPDHVRSAALDVDQSTSAGQPARDGVRSDSIVLMLLTIALAYILGLVVGRNA